MDYVEMKKFLSSQNKTDEQMQEMWDYCVENGHKLICQLDRCGKSWTDLNAYALSTLEREYIKLKDSVKTFKM